jgi:putative ABC transport system permease protein
VSIPALSQEVPDLFQLLPLHPICNMKRSSARDGQALTFSELVRLSHDIFVSDRVRFTLTALGMLIGTASLILVTTVSLAGKQYLLSEIRAIGANLIYAEQQNRGGGPDDIGDHLSIDDMQAVEHQVQGIVAASPVLLPLIERVPAGGGHVRTLQVMGVDPDYERVRNLLVTSGRFFDSRDADETTKVAVLNSKVAVQLYGSEKAAVGRTLTLHNLPFAVIGTFRERVETFGQSEVSDQTVLIPSPVVRYLHADPMVKQIFFSVADPSLVRARTAEVKRVLQSRHRPEAVYDVRNLTQLLSVASKTANAMTLLLLAVATVILIVSGIGIMNIMLDTVRSRIREIGVRKAVGATNRDIQWQFLFESLLIALAGGLIGILIGYAIPVAVRVFTHYPVPISGSAAILAIVVCSLVGIVFGTVPAVRAANLDPADSLRYE